MVWRVLSIAVAISAARVMIALSDRQYAGGSVVWGCLEPLMVLLRSVGRPLVRIGGGSWLPVLSVIAIIVLIPGVGALRRGKWAAVYLTGSLITIAGVRLSLHASRPPTAIHWVLLGFSLGLALLGALCFKRTAMASDFGSPDTAGPGAEDKPGAGYSRTSVWCIGLIMLIAFVFRFYRIDVIPPGQAQHTAEWGMIGAVQAAGHPVGILDRSDREFFFDQLRLRLAVEPHQQGLNILADWFLADWFRPSLVVQRSATAFVGLLCVLAIWWTGRAYFSGFTACMAAFLFAVAPWHVAHSRYSSIEHVLAILLVTLTMGCLQQYLRMRSIPALMALVIVLTADFYAYVTAQFIVPVVIIVWLSSILRSRNRRWISLAVMAVSLLIVSFGIAPKTGLYGFKEHVKLLNTQVSEHPDYMVQGIRIISRNAKDLADGIFMNGEGDAWFNKPGYLIWPVTALFVAGLGYALVRIRLPGNAVVLLWLVVGVIPTLPSAVAAPRRILCAMPAIYLLAAVGAGWIRGIMGTRFESRRWIRNLGASMAGLAIASGAWVMTEDHVIISEVLTNGPERRLAEIVCRYVRDHQVFLTYESHTRKEKIWIACGGYGPDLLDRIVFCPDPVVLASELSIRSTGEVNPGGVTGTVVIYPVDERGGLIRETLAGMLPEGDEILFNFDPKFRNHDAGDPFCRAWVVNDSDAESDHP